MFKRCHLNIILFSNLVTILIKQGEAILLKGLNILYTIGEGIKGNRKPPCMFQEMSFKDYSILQIW